MNIFILDTDQRICAQYHCDKHVVKMILETAQLLCSALWKYGESAPYALTHENHPCAIWTRKSKENWLWLQELGIELHCEYTYRYGKIHKSGILIENLSCPKKIPSLGLTDFAQAMPEEYKQKDAVLAYREYYKNDKKDILKYTARNIPEWIEGW